MRSLIKVVRTTAIPYNHQYTSFLFHSYIKTEQKEYITTVRSHSSKTMYVISSIDICF
jgi:hypothetical protein